ncbi:PilZ domain-containing protein [Marinobacter fonticola]|uniref:PilZ domain-containing protein n=1 Tax=Marinobacter fonticola TaxID=2603215 RepID=UPI0011E7536E|nr:PilZ domain-containing protein [Marinobacter fonticola]
MSSNRRAHIRTALNAQVSVTHPSLGRRVYNTRDISDGGIFIVSEGSELPELGDRVEVQVQGLPVPAPVLEMEVVRMSVDGFGLQFIDE